MSISPFAISLAIPAVAVVGLVAAVLVIDEWEDRCDDGDCGLTCESSSA
jgi:hypothetical protein